MRSTSCLVAAAFVVAACSGGTEAPATIAPPPVTPPPTSALPVSVAPLPSVAPMAAAERARTLRQARAAAHAHDYATALPLFQRLLDAGGRSPRLACEAGFVAHASGDDARAGALLDVALGMFDSDASIAAPLRVPLAMCLYNRGLVYEAQRQSGPALDTYQRSLRLRPNRVVQQHVDALIAGGAHVESAPVNGTLAGVTCRSDANGATFAAATQSELVAALAMAYRGEGFDGPTDASVELVRSLDLPAGSGARSVALFVTDDGSAMYASRAYVLVFAVDAGYRVVSTDVGGYDNTDHGHDGAADASLDAMAVENGVLRVDYTRAVTESSQDTYAWDAHPQYDCYEDHTWPTQRRAQTILCALGGTPDCVVLDVSLTTTDAGRTEYTCTNEDGDDVPGPSEIDEPLASASDFVRSIDVLPGQRVRVTTVSGSGAAATPTPGEHDWADGFGTPLDAPSCEREEDEE